LVGSALDRNTSFEPTDYIDIMRTARVRRDFLRPKSERPPHIGFGTIHGSGAHHTNDAMRYAIDLNRLADDGAIGAEAANSQRFGENRHAILARLLLRGSEKRTQNRNDAQHGKQPGAHACPVCIFGRPVAGERDIVIDDAGDRGKDIGSAAKFRKSSGEGAIWRKLCAGRSSCTTMRRSGCG